VLCTARGVSPRVLGRVRRQLLDGLFVCAVVVGDGVALNQVFHCEGAKSAKRKVKTIHNAKKRESLVKRGEKRGWRAAKRFDRPTDKGGTPSRQGAKKWAWRVGTSRGREWHFVRLGGEWADGF
jgi:hypothetical protein